MNDISAAPCRCTCFGIISIHTMLQRQFIIRMTTFITQMNARFFRYCTISGQTKSNGTKTAHHRKPSTALHCHTPVGLHCSNTRNYAKIQQQHSDRVTAVPRKEKLPRYTLLTATHLRRTGYTSS